jgi:preprotein translocase subunit SecA
MQEKVYKITPTDGGAAMQADMRNRVPLKFSGRKLGRNEPCPCGSGKKFKKCHQLRGMRGLK